MTLSQKKLLFFFLLFGIVFKCSGKLVVMNDQIAILEKKIIIMVVFELGKNV